MSHPITMYFHYELTGPFRSRTFVETCVRPDKDQVTEIDVQGSDREVRSLYEFLAPGGQKIQLPDQDGYLEESDVLPLLRALKIERQEYLRKRIESDAEAESRRLKYAAEEKARCVAKEAREKQENKEKEARTAEKLNWIEANGSFHLKKAIGRVFDCHRQYLTERAAIELPGFEFDWNNKALWGTCACPTLKTLELLDTLPDECDIVWLKRRHDYDDDDGYDDNEGNGEGEVIVYRKYLKSKYDLIKYL